MFLTETRVLYSLSLHDALPILVGAARDVAALEGQWDGSYSSAATGRSGSISFTGRPRSRQPDGRVEGDAPETLDQLFPSRATVGVANVGAGSDGMPRCCRARFNASSMFP